MKVIRLKSLILSFLAIPGAAQAAAVEVKQAVADQKMAAQQAQAAPVVECPPYESMKPAPLIISHEVYVIQSLNKKPDGTLHIKGFKGSLDSKADKELYNKCRLIPLLSPAIDHKLSILPDQKLESDGVTLVIMPDYPDYDRLCRAMQDPEYEGWCKKQVALLRDEKIQDEQDSQKKEADALCEEFSACREATIAAKKSRKRAC
jgi:hypothetical protein